MGKHRWIRRLYDGAVKVLCCAVLFPALACKVTPEPGSNVRGNVGLSIDIIDGQGALKLSPRQRTFYVEQLRFQVLQENFPAADVVDWIATQSEMAVLDWSGLQRVMTEFEGEEGDYEEVRGYLEAAWMLQEHTFSLEFLDAEGEVVAGPITAAAETSVMTRKTALSWATGQAEKGEDGENAGDYATVDIASGGSFGGPADDVYLVEVIEGGALDGRAKVFVTSVRGDSDPPPPRGQPAEGRPVVSGSPIALGIAGHGATLTFTDQATGGQLTQGDRWVVRVTVGGDDPETPDTDESVAPAEAAPHATFAAMSEIRLFVAKSETPLVSLPETTAQLRVTWSAKPDAPYVLPVTFASEEELVACYAPDDEDAPTRPCEYGFEARATLEPPENGRFYLPGETIDGEVEFFDGTGNRLHAKGQLPTYRQFITGQSQGILYFKSGSIPAGEGFFNEQRINITEVRIVGPKQNIKLNYSNGPPEDYFVDDHAYPETSLVFAGFGNPAIWDTPIPTAFEIELPEDALPGTYVVVVKGQRGYLGETIYRMPVSDIQVGVSDITAYRAAVGNCEVCHTVDGSLDRIRHGTKDHRICVACHPPRFGLLPEHVHTAHFLSPDYVLPRNDCSLCHLEQGSNVRASNALCGSCHTVHGGGIAFGDQPEDRHAACASSCHREAAAGHVQLPPQ